MRNENPSNESADSEDSYDENTRRRRTKVANLLLGTSPTGWRRMHRKVWLFSLIALFVIPSTIAAAQFFLVEQSTQNITVSEAFTGYGYVSGSSTYYMFYAVDSSASLPLASAPSGAVYCTGTFGTSISCPSVSLYPGDSLLVTIWGIQSHSNVALAPMVNVTFGSVGLSEFSTPMVASQCYTSQGVASGTLQTTALTGTYIGLEPISSTQCNSVSTGTGGIAGQGYEQIDFTLALAPSTAPTAATVLTVSLGR
jgi:hypothetical protein